MILNAKDPNFRYNPYPFFRQLRQEAPIARVEPFGAWAISRYDDVIALLRNPTLFSSANMSPEDGEGAQFILQTRALIGTDPPDHARLRGIIGLTFTPPRIQAWEGLIRSHARTLLAAIKDNSAVDLVTAFTAPLPTLVIGDILGIDRERTADFIRWTDTLLTWRNREHNKAEQTAQEIVDYFTELIDRRRQQPTDDLISHLIAACDHNQRLTPRELLAFLRLILVAGTETTTHLLGNTIRAICTGLLWRSLRVSPFLVPQAIEETLRFDGPVLALARRTAEDTEIYGQHVSKNDTILALVASANRDESVPPWRACKHASP
ncbi:MAG: cytochrome P450 [Deltaproteobacteria bacterium]|nr:cytochrome P450 [Deltaproteobacteria bacterium]MBI3296067.1 cytochrome P450 [Deltaproteobacteria bacterium]